MATLKYDLAAALAKIEELEPKAAGAEILQQKLDEATGHLTTANKTLDETKTKLSETTTKLDEATKRITALEGEKTKLSEANTKLESEAKTADERATEKAAAHSLPPARSDAETRAAATTDGATLYEEYEKLVGRERSAFFKANEKALMAYAAQLEKSGAPR